MRNKVFLFVGKILFLCFLVCGAAQCTSQESGKKPSNVRIWMEKNGKPKVLSTTAIIDDIVGKIGGDRIDHLALIVGEMDPHSYELVKGDDEKFSYANAVFSNGLGLEHGGSLRYQIEKHSMSVVLGDEVRKKYPEEIFYFEKQVDPHIWMDVSLWEKVIPSIVETLSLLDSEGSSYYQENGKTLTKKMNEFHQSIKEEMKQVPENKRYLVTSHDAFNYFTRAYLASEEERSTGSWENRCAAPEGLAPEGQLSVSDIKNIVEYLCRYQIHVVFPESNVNKDALKKIVHVCSQKGLEVRVSKEELYGDALGDSPDDGYFSMMQHNVDVLRKEWEKK